ncbi:hypothetical protein [Candidatus Frankia nodulisporulans]|uniref:hypothetical protein n=1 Tax=Candidatus Frankia nodulisporulans TaxID=2060052 RepID=UPI0013D3FF4F|nr:hypothetical protein [Candidatus Frankia nodulisporulans]
MPRKTPATVRAANNRATAALFACGPCRRRFGSTADLTAHVAAVHGQLPARPVQRAS